MATPSPSSGPVLAQETPTATSAESQDVSQRTIVILVVLTVILSFIGAWAGISATMHAAPSHSSQSTSGPAAAQVNFVIDKPVPLVDSTTGMVALTIGTSG